MVNISDEEKRIKLIDFLKKVTKDLEDGYGGFLYLYDHFFDFEGGRRMNDETKR